MGQGWGGEGKVGRAAALRRSGWRHAHDAFGGGAYAGPRQQLGSRHAIPGRHARRERRSCPLLFSAATSIGKQESLASDSLCDRWHGGGTHWRPLWYIWRGSPRARGSPGLTAAGVGRAHPRRPPADPGLNPPSPPTPTGRWDSPGAPGGKILCRWDSPGRSHLARRAGKFSAGGAHRAGRIKFTPWAGGRVKVQGGAAAASGSEYRDPLKTLNPKP